MEQKCSQDKVFGIFVDEPRKIHYIKQISKKINLAPTSVKIHLRNLEGEGLIVKKQGERFEGFVANRDDKNFLFYKMIANLINIKVSGLLDFLKDSLYPQAVILYGSYLRGEDVETSDIDLFILAKSKKRLELQKFEKILKRNIHLLIEKDWRKIPKELKLEVINGFVLNGYLKNG
ncbi:nucleotidyltransferase domain-containing protein [Nanoarchaeota archaeon]